MVKFGKGIFRTCIKIKKMQEIVFLSIPQSQLEKLIIDCVNACLDVRQVPAPKTIRKKQFAIEKTDLQAIIFSTALKAIEMNKLSDAAPTSTTANIPSHG